MATMKSEDIIILNHSINMKPKVLTGEIATKATKACRIDRCTKRELIEYFENAYSLDEWLFTSIKDEKYFYLCSDRLRLPLIFYYCHPAVVFVNKLLLCGLITERINPRLEKMFETGVDEMTWDDTENYRMGGEYDWPTVEESRIYRKKVREKIRQVIEDTNLEFPITPDNPWWAVWMGIEHERIHLETSSVLIRQLPVEMVEKPIGWKYAPLAVDQNETLDNKMIEAGNKKVTIGKLHEHDCLWGWDNEFGQRELVVPKFEASQFPITNAEFLQFVEDGGYEKKELWTNEGWKWRTFKQAKHPSFWVCNKRCKSGCGSSLKEYSHCTATNEDYRLRLMFDEVSLPANLPVEVNYHEAKAFCTWKGLEYRMPTEAEHHVMRGLSDGENPALMTNTERTYNFDMQYGSSTPVNFFSPSSTGFYDTFGNTWEWIEDDFNGLEGFETSFLYDDFSTPCFDGKHTMMLGGSWISTGSETSRHARYSFRRHFLQHMGFRLARTIEGKSPVWHVSTPVYVLGYGLDEVERRLPGKGLNIHQIPTSNKHMLEDTDENILKLAAQHYKEDIYQTTLKNYIDKMQLPKNSNALVIGCGPGKLAFQLTKDFQNVIGCDTSTKCLETAIQIQNGNFDFTKLNGTRKHFNIPSDSIPKNVVFKQLTWLPCELNKQFDLVVIGDFLTRVQSPKAWLVRLWELLRDSDSILVVTNATNEIKNELQTRFKLKETINGDITTWKLLQCFI